MSTVVSTRGVFLVEITLPAKARIMVLLGGTVSSFRYASNGRLSCGLTVEPPSWLKIRPWTFTVANLPEPPS